MYMDNYAVGTTQIGCGAAPPTDTTPPAQVTGVTAASKTDTTITYTWTANAAADGVVQYNVRGCTGSGCTNYVPIGTTSTTSFTWTGRSASTTYRVQVTAQDNASPPNVSTASAAVETTTNATTVLPTVTAFTPTTTGGQITYTGTPTGFRIAFGGTNGDGTFWNAETTRTLAQVPAGVFSYPWPSSTSWACVHAYDAVNAEDPVGYVCAAITPAPPAGSSGTYLRKLSSNPRWMTLDGTTAVYRVGISGGDNCNASFCGIQDLTRYNFTNLTTQYAYTTTFDGTSTDVGAVWTPITWGNDLNALTVVSGMLRPTNIAFFANNAELLAGIYEADPAACLTLGTFNDAGVQKAALIFATSLTADSGYEIRAVRNTTYTTRVNRIDAGSSTTLDDENATTWAAGDELCAEKTGPIITVKRNGTAVAGISISDATYKISYIGIMLGGTNSAASTEVTSFKAGRVVADYVTNLNTLVTAGSSWVRYWILEQSTWCSDASCAANTSIRIPFSQFPWEWTGATRTDTSTGTSIEVGIYDLNVLNQAFFDRVSARIDAALSRGITPIITMFSGGHLYYGTPPSWNAGFSHPFYSGNNVNGVSCDTNGNEACEEAHSIHTAMNNAQKAYVNRLVQTIGNRSVILEISNEDQTDSTLWQNMIMEQVRTAEALYGTDPHIIFQSGFAYGSYANSNHLFANSRNDAVSPLCTSDGTDWDINPPANDGTKLIFYDSDHAGYNDSCGTWTSIVPWKLFTRAIYTIFLSERESAGVQTAIKTAMAQTNLYSTKINLAAAYPETGTSVFSTGYGLFTGTNSTTPNCQEYLMLMPSDGTSTINLTACGVGATYTIEYLNLTSGAVTSGGTVNGGAVRSFNPSGSDPMVVLLESFVAADVTAPTVSGGSPTGVLASGTTSVVMTVITNEDATCKYGTVAATAYGSIASTFASTGATTHTQTISGLTDGATPTYYVRCQDVAGNANSSDYTVAWEVTATPPDVAPPTRSAGSPSGVLIHSTTSVSMTLTTDETATCKYGTVAGTAYGSIASTFTTTASTAHSQTISVAQGNTYTYYVRCTDGTNANVTDYVITWQVAASPDVTAPIIVNCATNPFGVLPSGTTSVDIECNTNENATMKMDSDPNIAYASQDTTFSTTGGTFHSQSVGSLADGTSYTRYLRTSDGVNATTTDYVVAWSVAAAAVTTPPADATNVRGTLDASTGVILWQWDEVATADHYIIEISRGETFVVAIETASASTFYPQGNLTVGTYTARVKAVDTSNTASVNWALSTAVSASLPETLVGLAQSGDYSNAVILTWTATTQNITAVFDRCTGVGCTSFEFFRTATGVTLTDTTVSANTTYGYRAKWSNQIFGGVSESWSDILYVTTRSEAATGSSIGSPRGQIPVGQERTVISSPRSLAGSRTQIP
jgi:hypothetical protein